MTGHRGGTADRAGTGDVGSDPPDGAGGTGSSTVADGGVAVSAGTTGDAGADAGPTADATATGTGATGTGTDATATGVAGTVPTARTDGPRERTRQVLAVAGRQYRLSLRDRWAYALVGLFALLAGLLAAVGGSRVGPAGSETVVVSLASLATYLVPLAALAFGYDAVVGAAEAGYLEVTSTLPVPRAGVVWGTYLGRAATLGTATALGFGAAGAAVVAADPAAAAPYARFLLAAVGLGLAFLALAVLVSTVAAEKAHALGVALLVWVWFVLLSDLVALGVLAAVDLPDAAVAAMVLANPADVFRLLVLRGVGTTGGVAAVLAGTGLSVPGLAAALLAWCPVPVAVAGRLVERRSV